VVHLAAKGAFEIIGTPQDLGSTSDLAERAIEGLLSGKERRSFPDLSRGVQTFKKAKR
jgi:hypothetical protein